MKSFTKSKLGLALAATLGAAAVAPTVQAVNIATDGIGEYAVAPYYTTRAGWATLINMTNTRPYPIAVKIRFREQRDSRDVFDFTVLLSAYDVFTAYVTQENGAPVIKVTDPDTCTVPYRLNNTVFRGFAQPALAGLDSADRAREGYIEFISMGHTGTRVDYNTLIPVPPEMPYSARPTDIGDRIQRHQCEELENLFKPSNIITTARQFGEPINALKVNVRLISVARGLEAEAQTTMWANFFNGVGGRGAQPFNIVIPPHNPGEGTEWQVYPDFNVLVADNYWDETLRLGCSRDRGIERRIPNVDWDPTVVSGLPDQSCINLITAQAPNDYYEPSANDAFPPVGIIIDDVTAGPRILIPGQVTSGGQTFGIDQWRMADNPTDDPDTGATPARRGVDALSATIQRAAVINEWDRTEIPGLFNSNAEWVLTFPTKAFYVDQGLAPYFAIVRASVNDRCLPPSLGPGNTARKESEYDCVTAATGRFSRAPYPPFYGIEAGSAGHLGATDTQVTIQINTFDREQNEWGDILASPFPVNTLREMRCEAQVLTFGGPSILGSAPICTTDLGPFTLDQDFNRHPQRADYAGWAKIRLDVNPNTRYAAENKWGLPGGLIGYDGLPVIGFMVKMRDFGNPASNYLTSVPHGYERRFLEGASR